MRIHTKLCITLSWVMLLSLASFPFSTFAQITSAFSYTDDGTKVCLVDASIQTNPPAVILHFLDAELNTEQYTSVRRRPLYGNGDEWELMQAGIAPGTESWTDYEVEMGQVWEYQVKRINADATFAIGYCGASLQHDQSDYRGQMILMMAEDVPEALPEKVERLKRDLTGDGWYVNELSVPKGTYGYEDGELALETRTLVQEMYAEAPEEDKPKVLFILGHAPVARMGTGLQPPDNHIEFSGARGADCFYADIDGEFTDTATYDVPEQYYGLTKNYPDDLRWDQDRIPSELEMAFGRVDFFRIDPDNAAPEMDLIELYLDRLHAHRHIESGEKMGTRSAAFFEDGYSNSTDGSFRSLPAFSTGEEVLISPVADPSGHCQWVQDNGPFLMYMQNRYVPNYGEFETVGMDALVYSSDQSAWGYGDMPMYGANNQSRVRSLLSADTKCLITLWTTSAINLFFQAGLGEPLGVACKQIMEHNNENQRLEKPEVNWDNNDWWNRTHFNFYGDPTLKLYQVFPASELTASMVDGYFNLEWVASTDEDLIGYHIYKSTEEFGVYDKISGDTPLTTTNFIDPLYQEGDWYMVRAINLQTTGSGAFQNASQGVFLQGEFPTHVEALTIKKALKIAPNPAIDQIHISTNTAYGQLKVWDANGKLMLDFETNNSTQSILDCSEWNSGTYFLAIHQNEQWLMRAFIKQ